MDFLYSENYSFNPQQHTHSHTYLYINKQIQSRPTTFGVSTTLILPHTSIGTMHTITKHQHGPPSPVNLTASRFLVTPKRNARGKPSYEAISVGIIRVGWRWELSPNYCYILWAMPLASPSFSPSRTTAWKSEFRIVCADGGEWKLANRKWPVRVRPNDVSREVNFNARAESAKEENGRKLEWGNGTHGECRSLQSCV